VRRSDPNGPRRLGRDPGDLLAVPLAVHARRRPGDADRRQHLVVAEDRRTHGSHPDQPFLAFEDLRPAFTAEVSAGDYVVAGHNFGSGSSREHAPLSLVGAGVSGIVAQSFARIFFRNALDLGLPVVICPAADRIDDGEAVRIDLDAGSVHDHTTDETDDAEALPEFLQSLVDEGELKAYTKTKLGTE
jgi:3-isopropylmalate/(R)-2-methylmalate dehydratase small subunit